MHQNESSFRILFRSSSCILGSIVAGYARIRIALGSKCLFLKRILAILQRNVIYLISAFFPRLFNLPFKKATLFPRYSRYALSHVGRERLSRARTMWRLREIPRWKRNRFNDTSLPLITIFSRASLSANLVNRSSFY